MITDPEVIRQYREKEIELVAIRFVRDMYKNNVTPEYFKGAIDVLRDIVNLPKKLAGESKEQRELAELLIKDATELRDRKTTRALLEAE